MLLNTYIKILHLMCSDLMDLYLMINNFPDMFMHSHVINLYLIHFFGTYCSMLTRSYCKSTTVPLLPSETSS